MPHLQLQKHTLTLTQPEFILCTNIFACRIKISLKIISKTDY